MVNKNEFKKVFKFLICIFGFLFLVFYFWPSAVLAQNQTTATSNETSVIPILLPDSPFYFLKIWYERIQLFVSFSAANKAKQFLHLAEVRLAEYQKMQAKGKNQIAEQALGKYQEQLGRAVQKFEEAKQKEPESEKIANDVARAVQKHLLILERVYQKVPEPARQGFGQAIQNSQKGVERIKELFFGQKKEEIQKETDEMKNKIDQGVRKGIKKLWPI